MQQPADIWDYVRGQIIGRETVIDTPFGHRRMTYADYTASGRGVRFIERYLERVLELYGNTHTEDDATGMVTTHRLHQAESTIKSLLGATDDYKLIEVGSGTTGAVHRLQQILGVYLPPAAKDAFATELAELLGQAETDALTARLLSRRPVVFVGPYEHHSNEVSWRECWVEVVEIELAASGLIDLEDLERKLSDPRYQGRRLIGAFSAASNVSGVKTPVYEVARILHRHGALAFFDFAAIAPYIKLNVHLDDLAYFDAAYFSPHKFLGGPGSSGLLIIHKGIYREDLAPTVGAGGTVNFVDLTGQDYAPDIEVREKPGTPGILQIMRASLAMQLVDRLGADKISAREDELVGTAIKEFSAHPAVEIFGPRDPAHRIAIISFNLREEQSYLHPRFVTLLLNDLFGIQSRAGCSCAGPYGHRMLHLDNLQSAALRDRVNRGVLGLRPGWVRVNFHFMMTDDEARFLRDAILFVADHGRFFLPLYRFDMRTGSWSFRGADILSQVRHELGTNEEERHSAETDTSTDRPLGVNSPCTGFGLEEALALVGPRPECSSFSHEESDHSSQSAEPTETSAEVRREYLATAMRLATALQDRFPELKLRSTLKDLIPFVYVQG